MRLHVFALTLVCLGCGGGAGPNDAGPREDRPRIPPRLPDPPALPMITPCPDGWREIAGLEGVAECDPWPETGYRTDCAFDEAHLVGTPTCVRVGTACPADGWPEALPTDRPIVFVDDGAVAGGDGTTRTTAFSSIATAVASAPANAVIAIATGTYDTIVPVGAGQTLWGACVTGTRLTSSMAASDATVVGLTGAGSGVRNLAIDTPERTAIVIAATGTTIEDVVIQGARVVAISITSGSVTARRVVVRDTRERVEDGRFGNGISVAPGATLTLEQSVLERNRNGALSLAGGGAHADVRGTVLSDTRGEATDDRFGHGVATAAGSTITLEECAIERNHAEGIFANGTGTIVDVQRSVLRDTLGQESDDMFGRAADALGGASLSLTRTVASGNHMGGLYATSPGTQLELTDVVVRDTSAQTSDGLFGIGMHVVDGSVANVTRVLVAQNRTAGIFAGGGSLIGADLTVTDTQPQASDMRYGRGIHASEGATVDVDRVRIAHNHEVGLGAIGAGTEVTMTHLLVSDTRAQQANGTFGGGISAEDGAIVAIDVAQIETAIGFGAQALGGADVTLSELTIAGIESNAAPASGFGLVASEATMRVTHFAIREVAACAYLLGPGASIDLMQGDVESVPVGACMQIDGYDTSRLHNDVVYRAATPQSDTAYVLPEALPMFY